MSPEIEKFLTAAAVDCRVHRHAPVVSFAESKAALPFDPDASVKCLAFRLPSGAYAIVALRGDARADYKKIAAALGVRRGELKTATAEELARDLDMEPGGVAPLPVLGATVLFDRQTLDLDTIFCGAGRAGTTLDIQHAELVRIAGGATADLTKS
jgi:Cys-tRNA(Pro)/Cys-tRNA(Cys) deacylase